MKELQVFEFNGQHVVDSREVAEMVVTRHAHLLDKIKGYVEVLEKTNEPKIRSVDFFIPNTYQDSKGEVRPCYLLTRKGCDMVANKMTGEKGVLFTATYVSKFEQMEEFIKNGQQKQFTAREQLLLIMQANEETAQRVDAIEGKVDELHNTMRIDGNQEKQIQDRAKAKVVNELGGKETNAYKEISGKVFRAFWKEFKDYFEIPRYGELPKSRFAEAIKFIEMWQASTSTRMEIDACNEQMELGFK